MPHPHQMEPEGGRQSYNSKNYNKNYKGPEIAAWFGQVEDWLGQAEDHEKGEDQQN